MNDSKCKVLILFGPNLNMNGKRETNIYSDKSHSEIVSEIVNYAEKMGIKCECIQSNYEGMLIDKIQKIDKDFDFIMINAGALSHYSIALRDAIAAVDIPTIEVHMSNIYAREGFRRTSVLSEVCKGVIVGFGCEVYKIALDAINKLQGNSNDGSK